MTTDEQRDQRAVERLRRSFHVIPEWLQEPKGLDTEMAVCIAVHCQNTVPMIDGLEQILKDYRSEIARLKDVHSEIAKLRADIGRALERVPSQNMDKRSQIKPEQ